tara:strand:- start:1036 stop:1782 length:747 start_codon:yes stop_codon:yes gene_type:complete
MVFFTDVLEFRLLANQCHEMVGTINGAFSSISYQPIQWMYHGVTPVELAALYNIADALIVSSLRDGMNLTALEYVACQQEACPSREGPGVLLLSEFAGAAQSLISAVRVNPWNTDELADAMHHALTMPCAERRKRHASMYRHVREHTSIEWGKVRCLLLCAAVVVAVHTYIWILHLTFLCFHFISILRLTRSWSLGLELCRRAEANSDATRGGEHEGAQDAAPPRAAALLCVHKSETPIDYVHIRRRP